MIESRLPSSTFGIDDFRNTLRFYALMDAILSPEWEYRFYSFDSTWDVSEQMGSMRNGQGDEFFAHFTPKGCLIKGFDHESAMSPWSRSDNSIWPGMFDSVPTQLGSSLVEPAFSMDNTTFCVWRTNDDSGWYHSQIVFPGGDDPDGMEHLLSNIQAGVASYCEFATDYYEVQLDASIVERVRLGEPLTDSLVSALNNELDATSIASDVGQIGWSSYRPVNL